MGVSTFSTMRWELTPFQQWVASNNLYSLKTDFDQPVMLGVRGVGFSKGGQNWPQICSMRLSFWDMRPHLLYNMHLCPWFLTPAIAQLVKAPVHIPGWLWYSWVQTPLKKKENNANSESTLSRRNRISFFKAFSKVKDLTLNQHWDLAQD